MRTAACATLALLVGYASGIAIETNGVDMWLNGLMLSIVVFGLSYCIGGETK